MIISLWLISPPETLWSPKTDSDDDRETITSGLPLRGTVWTQDKREEGSLKPAQRVASLTALHWTPSDADIIGCRCKRQTPMSATIHHIHAVAGGSCAFIVWLYGVMSPWNILLLLTDKGMLYAQKGASIKGLKNINLTRRPSFFKHFLAKPITTNHQFKRKESDLLTRNA